MTTRDYFAGLAMQQILREENKEPPYPSLERVAATAWDIADAMMEERKKHAPRIEDVVQD